MTVKMNGSTYSGTPEEIVEQIRKGWMWQPLPTTEELFKYISGLLKRPVKTAKEYIAAMVELGLAKVIPDAV